MTQECKANNFDLDSKTRNLKSQNQKNYTPQIDYVI
jgi:hypothetical protein